MRFGESYDEACRFCGSNQIIVWPPSSAGNCAVCSEEARAWEARQDQLAGRRLAIAQAALLAAGAKTLAAERARRWAARRAALVEACAAFARRGMALGANGIYALKAVYSRETRAFAARLQRVRRGLMRPAPPRSRTAH